MAGLRFQVVWRDLPWLLKGAFVTLRLSVLSIGLAMVFGLALALLRHSHGTPARVLVRAYVDVIRGTPLLVQILVVYYVLPRFGLELGAFQAGVLALSLNSAAYVAEILRGGILSIHRGQIEASRALGMTSWQTTRRIILPQLMGLVIPPLTNEFVKVIKGSSIVSVIAVIELTRTGQQIIAATFAPLEIYAAVGMLYFLMSALLLYFSRQVERRVTQYR